MDIIDEALGNIFDEFDKEDDDEFADFFLECYSFMVDEEYIDEVPDKECDDVTKNEWIRDNIPVMRQFIEGKINDSSLG